MKAIERMKDGKAIGPVSTPVDVWESLGDGMAWPTKLFNKVLEGESGGKVC